MKPRLRNPPRFSSPSVLDMNVPFFGATVKEWHQTFTGNMDKKLAELKRRQAPTSAPDTRLS